MKIILEDISGLGEDSPLYTYLKLADKCLQEKQSWYEVHKVMPVISILASLFHFMGHPVTHSEPTVQQLKDFINFLCDNGETCLSNLCEQLLELGPKEARLTMMYIIVNLGLLKQKEDSLLPKIRSIDDEWFGPLPPDTEWLSYLEKGV